MSICDMEKRGQTHAAASLISLNQLVLFWVKAFRPQVRFLFEPATGADRAGAGRKCASVGSGNPAFDTMHDRRFPKKKKKRQISGDCIRPYLEFVLGLNLEKDKIGRKVQTWVLEDNQEEERLLDFARSSKKHVWEARARSSLTVLVLQGDPTWSWASGSGQPLWFLQSLSLCVPCLRVMSLNYCVRSQTIRRAVTVILCQTSCPLGR